MNIKMEYKMVGSDKYLKSFPDEWIERNCAECNTKPMYGVIENIRVSYCKESIPIALQELIDRYEKIVEDYMTPAPEEEQVMTTPTYQGYEEFSEYRAKVYEVVDEIERRFTEYYINKINKI